MSLTQPEWDQRAALWAEIVELHRLVARRNRREQQIRRLSSLYLVMRQHGYERRVGLIFVTSASNYLKRRQRQDGIRR